VGGEVSALSGDGDQAHSQFARSLELLDGIRAPLERAHTQLRAGLTLTRSGNTKDASELLMSSYHIARRLAARPLVRATTAALAETGEGVDLRPGRSGTRALAPAGLTRREREVLGHLAKGRTNREIAAALFLSTRTVDMHVRNILAKLGCSSRATAVRRAAELSIVPADR
jgi:DNA-binding NarL/FixJ family response regulator